MYSRVYVEITNICNRACSFCPGTVRAKKRMTAAEFAAVCDKLVGVTEYIYLHVMGEPLTHPEVAEIVKIGTEKGFKIAITTNGTLLDKMGEAIVEAGVYKVNISVHSFEEGAEEEHLNYLKKCVEFAKYAHEKDVLTVLRLWNRGHDGGKNDTVLELLHSEFPLEWKHSARGARIKNRLHLEWGERFEWPDSEAEDRGDSVFCYGLADHFGVLSDGTIIPCCLDREGVIALGNIFEDDVREVLSGERARNMREGFKCRRATEELCRKCGYARRF